MRHKRISKDVLVSVAVAHSYSAVVYARTWVTHSPLGGSYENGL